LELIYNFAKLSHVQIAEQYPNPLDGLEPETSRLTAVVPTPNDPPWTLMAAIAAWIASVLLILFLPSLFLLPYLTTLEPRITETAELIKFAQSDKTAIFLQVLSIIPAHILTLLMSWYIVTGGRKYSFRDTLGWADGGVRWWHYLAILVGFMAIAAFVTSFSPEQDNDLLRILRSSRATVYVVAFMATFMAPIVEEVIYRGLLYSAFQRSVGVPAAFVIVTMLFAVVHVPQYYPSYSTIFLLTFLSVLLTALRVRSNNLLPCIILHMLFNGMQSAMIIMESHSDGAITPDPVGAFLWFLK